MFKSKKILSKVLFVFISILITSSLIACENKTKAKDIINMSESELVDIYKNINIGDNIETVQKKIGKETTITKSDFQGAKEKYIWIAVDFGNKHAEFDVDNNGKILNKRTELSIK